MKKTFILLLVAVALAGCETYNTGPYNKMGAYGFTYDLDNSPSPFVDTRYRPLTPYDLAAPIIVVVTNQLGATFQSAGNYGYLSARSGATETILPPASISRSTAASR